MGELSINKRNIPKPLNIDKNMICLERAQTKQKNITVKALREIPQVTNKEMFLAYEEKLSDKEGQQDFIDKFTAHLGSIARKGALHMMFDMICKYI